MQKRRGSGVGQRKYSGPVGKLPRNLSGESISFWGVEVSGVKKRGNWGRGQVGVQFKLTKSIHKQTMTTPGEPNGICDC